VTVSAQCGLNRGQRGGVAEDRLHGREVADHRLLGRYRDQEGAAFRPGGFHDRLISYGSLPVSVIEWLMFGDSTAVRATTGR
jgi:hypothetical protein